MAIAYHRDQAGAPSLTYGTAAATSFNALKDILKACLVSGYGAKSAAGWELIAEAASYLVLRNGSHSGYVCFAHENTQVIVSLAATYTGVSGSRIQGDGATSGKSASSSVPHKFTIRDMASYSANSTWFMVADAKTFVLGTSTLPGAANGEIGSSSAVYGTGVVYCGEDSSGNFICCGGEDTTSTGTTASTRRFDSAGFTSLRHPNTGLLVDTGSISVAMPGMWSGGSGTPQWFNAGVFQDVWLSPISWMSGGVVSNFRGLGADPRLMYVATSSVARVLGFPGTMTSREGNTPVDLGDGYTYFVAPKAAGYIQNFLITDNPRFW